MDDPRVERTRRHKLQDIVDISVMAVIGFADGCSDIEASKASASMRRAATTTC